MSPLQSRRFHNYSDIEPSAQRLRLEVNEAAPKTKHTITEEREMSYQIHLHAHPFVQQLTKRLIQQSIGGLQAADTEYQLNANGSIVTLADGAAKPLLYDDDLFSTTSYRPSALVQQPYPIKDIDFTTEGAYSCYNWELFFHVPLQIAIQLSKNQCFAAAQQWFHYIFDPTDDSDGPTPQRFWKVRPFQQTDVERIEHILLNLSTEENEGLKQETIRSIEAWKNAPFRPHVVARYRWQAYMLKTVMSYLDNLVAWGDSLYRKDTREDIDEAMIQYVLAANILGPRPLPVPRRGKVRPQTYANLRHHLDAFGNSLRDLETDVTFDLSPHPIAATDNSGLAVIRSLGQSLYFCIPRNDKLLGYWDTVADRLFKIRNSLNLQGVFRQLALFEPPIDPALLARAAASGLDVSAIVGGLNQPLPLVRFQVILQKAAELCQEVKSLGSNLLSAMEKEDGEAMALLRARHERSALQMTEQIKYGQWQEAIKAREGLVQSLANAVQRYAFYERQLGKSAEDIKKSIPELDELEPESLRKMNLAMQEGELTLRDLNVNIAGSLRESGGKIVSSHEAEELDKASQARDIQEVIRWGKLAAQAIRPLPDFAIKFHFWGLGGDAKTGGTSLADVASLAADVALAIGDRLSYEAGSAAKIGSFARRELDWGFQSNLAAGEINQIFKQLRGAQIREALTQRELENHRQQIVQAQEIDFFLTGEKNANWTQPPDPKDPKDRKSTNKAFYSWMRREVKGLYGQSFQFACDTAKMAERALQRELGNRDLSYISFGYLAGKEGLLAGEKLYLDVKRMEMAYHELNQREYELTKHVSVQQLDPLALLSLRMTGRCTIKIPEAVFDMDCPGHFFRRIKTVALSTPCVTGPYASLCCTLTLLKSSIRISPSLSDGAGYVRDGDDSQRFEDYFGSMQSIVTSSAQNDSGLFETNLRDERYLPFEYSGVISEWQLQLPVDPSQGEPAQFDYKTISDAILHFRYTAREGGVALRTASIGALNGLIESAEAAGSVRLFSVRYEFPTEWALFMNQKANADGRYGLKLTLRPEHYPFWAQGRLKTVKRTDIYVRSVSEVQLWPASAGDGEVKLTKDPALGDLFVGELKEMLASPAATGSAEKDGQLELFFDKNSMADLWIAVRWSE